MNYTLNDFVSTTGKVQKKQFISFINSVSIKEFTNVVNKPLLISRVLYDGQLGASSGSSGTMLFNVQSIREELEAINKVKNIEDPSSGIYVLKKNIDSTTPAHAISIGRVIPNDLIIPDYTISKSHATIICHYNEYYIYDHDSTNGTQVAGLPVSKSKPQLLEIGDTIKLGRIAFVLLSPEDTYELFYK